MLSFIPQASKKLNLQTFTFNLPTTNLTKMKISAQFQSDSGKVEQS
jgi:hypothetical protein